MLPQQPGSFAANEIIILSVRPAARSSFPLPLTTSPTLGANSAPAPHAKHRLSSSSRPKPRFISPEENDLMQPWSCGYLHRASNDSRARHSVLASPQKNGPERICTASPAL